MYKYHICFEEIEIHEPFTRVYGLGYYSSKNYPESFRLKEMVFPNPLTVGDELKVLGSYRESYYTLGKVSNIRYRMDLQENPIRIKSDAVIKGQSSDHWMVFLALKRNLQYTSSCNSQEKSILKNEIIEHLFNGPSRDYFYYE